MTDERDSYRRLWPSDPPRTPLHGTKTHPLSEIARGELADIALAPVPCQGVNPGVANRLLREDLVELVDLPSPFPTHKGKKIQHLKITDAGRRALAAGP